MNPGALLFLAFAPLAFALGCQSLDRFDTKGKAAYCGSILSSAPVRTPEQEGGFGRIRMRLEIDADRLTSAPGTLTTDDAEDGPCAGRATFDGAPLRVTPEVVEDAISTMVFDDGQVHNVVAWVDSTCRGPMLAVVSLYKNDRVDVRLLKPQDAAEHAAPPDGGASPSRDAFARFVLQRSETGCDY